MGALSGVRSGVSYVGTIVFLPVYRCVRYHWSGFDEETFWRQSMRPRRRYSNWESVGRSF